VNDEDSLAQVGRYLTGDAAGRSLRCRFANFDSWPDRDASRRHTGGHWYAGGHRYAKRFCDARRIRIELAGSE
jgi:hypothetical protein